MANAHRWRHRKDPCKSTDCVWCKANNTQRKAQGLKPAKQGNGHHRNPGKK